MIRHRRPTPIWSSLLCGASLLVATPVLAQVEITEDTNQQIETATAAADATASDVTIASGTVVSLEQAGTAVTVNSDNALINAGTISATNVDNVTGVDLQGGSTGSFLHSGSINLTEDLAEENTDDDPFIDTPFAVGSGRTGILVSGASPFTGDVTAEQASSILIEGNNSYGIDLSNTAMSAALDGSMNLQGRINVRGNDSAGVRIGGGVTGDVIHDGATEVLGVGSRGFDINGDIGGGFANSGSITTNGFRFASRPPFNPSAAADRLDLGADDLGQAGSTIEINGNVARGINLYQRSETTTDADGNETTRVVSISNVQQGGSAPAILIDGEGTPLAIGTVSAITDPTADGYDAELLYAFINDGTIGANGVYDDFDATTLSVSDARLEGGIRNAGTMRVETFVGGVARDIEGVATGTGQARVIVVGDGGTVDRLDNDGFIIAQVSEATDEVYFDTTAIPEARTLVATAIDIAAGGSLESIINDGQISATLTGRLGTATAIRDASGTLSSVTNRGILAGFARNSDSNGREDTDFTLVAMDLSANTSGVAVLQEQAFDPDPDDDFVPNAPVLIGDILLGSGDDTVISTAGSITGGIAFGAGNDALSLTSTDYDGAITNQDGLVITVVDSALTMRSEGPVQITSATFDETSTFSPLVDGTSGQAATLQATGAISFANGAQVNPIFNNIIAADSIGGAAGTFTLASAANLSVADITALNAADDGSFLLDTGYAVQGNDLVITVDLRGADALGLDSAQTGLDGTTFNATLQALQANTALGNEVANIGTSGEFYAAYNQLMPEFGAAARQFVLANTDGAVGAVANHLDSVRRSQDEPGGAWIQQFAYFADRDLAGLSEQYRGGGFGFAAGLDKAIGPFHAVGVNVGFASTEIEDVVGIDEPLDVTTLIAGLYAGYERGNLGIDGWFGGGLNQFEQNRIVRVGDFIGQSTGDWDGTHINGGVRVGYDMNFGERYWARPVASLDYMRLSEDGFEETGDLGVALSVMDRTSDVGSFAALMNFGAEYNGRRTWVRPSVRVGYRNEFISDPVLTEYMFSGIMNAALAQTESADFPSSGLLIGFSIAAGSSFSSFGFDFDSDIRDGFVRHTGRVVVRLLF